jgi:eukaryotic-like serine/threonine-protein kinase
LGAIFYECLTGRPPFVGADVLDVLTQVVSDEPVAVRALTPRTPRDLETICHKCLRKEAAQRYATAAELSADLRRWLAGEAITARAVGPLERAARWARRRPAVAGLLAVIVVGVAVAFWAQRREQLRTAEALREAKANLKQAITAVDECFGLAKDNPRIQAENLRKVRLLLLEKTLPFYENFSTLRPDDLTVAGRQADYLLRVAYITAEIGSKAEAIRGYQRAVEVLSRLSKDHPQEDDVQYYRAQSYNRLGDLQRETGKQVEALATFERADNIFSKLREAHPEDPTYQAGLGQTYHNLGMLLAGTGKGQEAIRHYERALALRVRLRKEHPEVAEYQADLAGTWNNLGVAHNMANQRKQAVVSYEKARDIHQSLVKSYPEVTRYTAHLVHVYGNLAFLQAEAGQSKEAQANYQQALDLHSELARAHPDVTEYQDALAHTWNNLGILQASTGRPKDAFTSWEQARKVYHRMSKAHPEVPEYQTRLAGTCCNLGILLRDGGEAEKSLERFDEAIRSLEEVRRRVPDDATAGLYLANSRFERAKALGRLGRHRDAVVEWDMAGQLDPGPRRPFLRRQQALALAYAGEYARAIQLAEQPVALQKPSAPALSDLAWVYALSARSAAGDAARPLPEREKNAERWARQAVDLLRQSHRGGFFRAREAIHAARESRDLDFLRTRDDFKAWLAGLGK